MDKKKWRNILFFVMGIAIFMFVFKDFDVNNLFTELKKFKWNWLLFSIGINMLSQYIRALRWNMLITSMGYKPSGLSVFLSILIMGFTNQLIPRGGEIARLSVLNKHSNIPFSKLLGTAVTERLTDFIVLLLLFAGLLAWQYDNIKKLIHLPQVNYSDINVKMLAGIIGLAALIVTLVIVLVKRIRLKNKHYQKIDQLKKDIKTGISTFKNLTSKVRYLLYTLLIYSCWLAMSYVLFFAFSPTEHLGLKAAALTYGLSTMAFLLPIQAGIGAWHFVVIQSLALFMVNEHNAQVFALVAHASTNFIFLLVGPIALLVLYFISKQKTH